MKKEEYRDNGMMAVGTILVATGAMSDNKVYKIVRDSYRISTSFLS